MEGISSEAKQENKIVDFVIHEVSNYEDLNAINKEESDIKFETELIKTLERQIVDERLGDGGQFLVQRLKNHEGIVVKRLMKDEFLLMKPEDMSIEEYWELIQRQHGVVLKYFGDLFVPKTEFVEVNTNFGQPTPDNFAVNLGFERVMIQEEITGLDAGKFLTYGDDSVEVSNQLRGVAKEFILRYRKMMKEEKSVIEDQVLIDFITSEIHITDTNHYKEFKDGIENNPYIITIGVDPGSILDSNMIIDLISSDIPDTEKLFELPYKEFICKTDLHYFTNTSVSYQLREAFNQKYSERPDFQKIQEGFFHLIGVLQNFPPNGENDNLFLLAIKNRFGIEE
jgi:hypothetical protein